jgi:nucleotide-binding universal stress UspA family protein
MRILAAVDGSDQSLHAVRAVEHLAHAEKVVMLHALDVPTLAYPMYHTTGVPRTLEGLSLAIEQAMRADGKRLLDRVVSLLLVNAGSVVKKLKKGLPGEVILTTAEKMKADLIVLGSRGLGPVKELLLGSVSHRVLTHASCPTLIVNRPMPSLRHILMAVQGPEDAAAITKFLARRPFRKPIQITVLTVLPFDRPLFPARHAESGSFKEKCMAAGRSFLEKVVSDLSSLGIQATGRILIGAPAPAILEEGAASRPDLILMGSRGRHGLTRFVLGSVSHAVLHRSPCPMLIVR